LAFSVFYLFQAIYLKLLQALRPNRALIAIVLLRPKLARYRNAPVAVPTEGAKMKLQHTKTNLRPGAL